MSDFELQAQSIPPTNRSASTQQKATAASNPSFDNKTKAGVRAQVQPMKFPLEHQERFKGHVSFQAIETIPPDISVSKKLQNFFIEAAGGNVRPSEADPEGAEAVAALNNPPSNENIKVEPLKLKILDGEKVTMFLPISFVVNDIISYENSELGATGAAGLQALQNTGDIAAAAGQAIKTGVAGLKDIFAAGSSLSGVAGRIAVARGASFIPNQTARDVIRSAAQVTVNPNVRSIFRGVALREFTFQFKLIPTSLEESREIKKIIKFFRYHAYPESLEIAGVPIAYTFPNMFKIKLMYKNSPVGTRIKMCYLRNVSTNYNPTASSFHSDGSPAEIDLTLSFVENRTLTRQDIQDLAGDTSTLNPDYLGNDPTDANFLDDGSGF